MQPNLEKAAFPPGWDPAWIEQRTALELRRHREVQSLPVVDGTHLGLPFRFLRRALKAGRLYRPGYRNFLDLRLNHLTHCLPGWPPALDGFRMLQLTDLHIDLDPALLPVILDSLKDVACEMAVLTGDFGEGAKEDEETVVRRTLRILEAIGHPPFGRYGILGNHDSLALAAALQAAGLPLLINEAVVLGSGHSAFALAGVDDAFFFQTENVLQAAAGCPPNLPKILLSHSPQVAPVAREAGFSLLLSGHTHGGQICFPGGHAILTMENIPRRIFRGLWKQGPLTGYTSTGTGSCHLPIRFNCPPEMVLHTLRTGA